VRTRKVTLREGDKYNETKSLSTNVAIRKYVLDTFPFLDYKHFTLEESVCVCVWECERERIVERKENYFFMVSVII
jgi:hypothetical protein